MKNILSTAIVAAILTVGTFSPPAIAAEPPRGTSAYGVLFLPLDFYPKHREELGLSEDQVREMHRIAEGMREPGEKIEAAMRERAKGLQEAIAQNPVDPELAMDRFQAVIKVENEMKALQFRARIAMRKVLSPEQYAKVPPLAKKEGAARSGEPSNELREKFERVKQAVRERIGSGEPPRELVEKFEQIEQAAKQGRMDEANQQLDGILRHLREEHGSREASAGKRAENAPRPGAAIEQQQRRIAEEIERTTDPEKREHLQREMRKLRESQEQTRGSAEGKRREEGPSRDGREGVEKRMQQIAEAAQRTDNPEQREQLQGAMRGLREATEAGNREAVENIMRAIEPVLRGAKSDREKSR